MIFEEDKKNCVVKNTKYVELVKQMVNFQPVSWIVSQPKFPS